MVIRDDHGQPVRPPDASRDADPPPDAVAASFLNYESQGRRGQVSVETRDAIRSMVWPTVGAGVWPIALLFAVIPSDAIAALSIVIIFWTLLAGGRGVIRIGRAQAMQSSWWVCESLTGAALLVVAILTVLIWNASDRPFDPDLAVLAGFATLLLAGTTHRHWVRYHVLANWASMLGRDGQAERFTMLALLRTGYEAVWLLGWTWLLLSSAFYTGPDRPDANLLLGLAVAIGALGFGIIWVWAVVEQALLERAVR